MQIVLQMRVVCCILEQHVTTLDVTTDFRVSYVSVKLNISNCVDLSIKAETLILR